LTILPDRENKNSTIAFLSWLITFHFVCFCWIFFRAENMNVSGQVLYQIFNKFSAHVMWEFIQGYGNVFTLIIIGYILHFTPKKIETKVESLFTKSPLFIKSLYVVIVIFILVQFKSSEIQPFIYFQF
jgi:hypothetical protein